MATYLGDTPLIKYDCGESVADLSTIRKLYYKKPDGSTGEWPGTISGTDFIQFQTTSHLNMAGRWEIQPYLSDGTVIYHGVIKELIVETPVKTTA